MPAEHPALCARGSIGRWHADARKAREHRHAVGNADQNGAPPAETSINAEASQDRGDDTKYRGTRGSFVKRNCRLSHVHVGERSEHDGWDERPR